MLLPVFNIKWKLIIPTGKNSLTKMNNLLFNVVTKNFIFVNRYYHYTLETEKRRSFAIESYKIIIEKKYTKYGFFY